MAEAKETKVVLDVGSLLTKVSLSTSTTPIIFPSEHTYTISEETEEKVMSFRSPFNRDYIVHWDDLEELWTYALLHRVDIDDPDDVFVLFAESDCNTINRRELIIQTGFEGVGVAGLCLGKQALLSLFSTAKSSTGLVLNSGDGITTMVPVVAGHIQGEVMRMELAGRDASSFFGNLVAPQSILHATGFPKDVLGMLYSYLGEPGEWSHVPTTLGRQLKEKFAYVRDLDEKVDEKVVDYQLPDGETLQIGAEKSLCGEVFFQPELIGKDLYAGGLPTFLVKAIKKTSREHHKNFFRNIVLAGGSTQLQGFQKRLLKETTDLLPPFSTLSLDSAPQNSTWLGGTMWASLSTFEETCFAKWEYEEDGAKRLAAKSLGLGKWDKGF